MIYTTREDNSERTLVGMIPAPEREVHIKKIPGMEWRIFDRFKDEVPIIGAFRVDTKTGEITRYVMPRQSVNGDIETYITKHAAPLSLICETLPIES